MIAVLLLNQRRRHDTSYPHCKVWYRSAQDEGVYGCALPHMWTCQSLVSSGLGYGCTANGRMQVRGEDSMMIFVFTDVATKLVIWGIVIHLFADWLLQNHWQAQNKSNLLHPASWVHSGIHLVGLLLIFPVWMAAIIAIIHLLIDTRIPLQWWRKFYRQTREGDVALHVAMWSDQVLHFTVIALAALIIGSIT